MMQRALVRMALCLGVLSAGASAHHPHDVVTALAVSPSFAQDRTVFVGLGGTMNLFLISRDGGYTWRDSRSGLRGSAFSAIEFASDWRQSGVAWAAIENAGIQMTTDGGRTWQPPTIRRRVHRMTVTPVGPEGKVAIFFSTWTELFVSEDRGRTDRAVALPSKTRIDSIAVSPTFWSDQTVAVSTADSVLWISRDAGATWSQVKMPAAVQHVCFSSGHVRDLTLWASTWGKGVLRSTDGGRTFEPNGEGLADAFVNQCVVVRRAAARDVAEPLRMPETAPSPYELFAATRTDGVYRSPDGGATWARTGLRVEKTDQTDNHHTLLRAASDHLGNRWLFCGTFEGVYISDDGGGVWRQANVNPTRNGRLVEVSPSFATDRTVVACGYGMHPLLSTDGGDRWGINWSFPGWSVYSIGISPRFAQDRLILLGLGTYFVRSPDAGATWTFVPLPRHPDPQIYLNVRAIAYSPRFGQDDQTVFGISYGGIVSRSDDAGASWKILREEIIATGTTSIALSPDFVRDKTLFVSGAGVFKSTDGGMTFTKILDDHVASRGLVVPPDFAQSGELYCMADHAGFVRFTEGGAKWIASIDGLEGFLPSELALSAGFAQDRTICATTFGGGFFKSTDAGRKWQRISPFPSPVDGGLSLAISPSFASDGTVFVGTYDGFFRSRDGGATWQPVTSWEWYDDFREPWVFHGTWSRERIPNTFNHEVNASANKGNRAELPFDGFGFRLLCTKGPDHGIAEVWLDGELLASVDLYAPQLATKQVVAERLDLQPGHHVLEVRVTGQRRSEASGARVAVDAVEVTFR
jgi:photosystem II stability/assembly factor-like uncharacterized protein